MLNFMRYRLLYLFISSLILVPGLFILVTKGLKPSIDFTGGALLEIKVEKDQQPTTDEVKKIIEDQKIEVGSIQPTSQGSLVIRLKPLEQSQHEKISVELTKQFGTINEIRFESIGPTLGKELLQKTFIVSLTAIVIILSYVAWAFKNIRYGVSAIIALIHDLLVVVSAFALLGYFKGIEVDSLFVTAILTTMSFSVHDTIVVFDRIREHQKQGKELTFEHQVNIALTETMGRSLNNSLTIIFMLLALFLIGGDTIKWFSFALLVGTISGTYSSPFVATPILYVWYELRKK